jgi:hypothetical protein
MINAAGTLYQGGITVTSNGTGCTSQPTVSFPSGNISGAAAFVFFSPLNIVATEFPTAINNVMSFYSFLAHCSAGGTSPGVGTCTPFSAQPIPGNPKDLHLFGDSAGSQLALLSAATGTTYLDNILEDPGYSEWSDKGFAVTAVGVWSVAVDLANMYSSATTRSAQWALPGMLGWPTATNAAAASPKNFLTNASPQTLMINGSLDPITPASDVSAACAAAPASTTCMIIQGQSHELDVWTYPGLTLGNILNFLLAIP